EAGQLSGGQRDAAARDGQRVAGGVAERGVGREAGNGDRRRGLVGLRGGRGDVERNRLTLVDVADGRCGGQRRGVGLLVDGDVDRLRRRGGGRVGLGVGRRHGQPAAFPYPTLFRSEAGQLSGGQRDAAARDGQRVAGGV